MDFTAQTLDDLLFRVLQELEDSGEATTAFRGSTKELLGVKLCLTQPRARLSRSEGRGRAFSPLGEFLWYLAGSNRLDHIEYYLPRIGENSDDGVTLYGAYGPRLLGPPTNQLDNVLSVLRHRTGTRRAVIQLFRPDDLIGDHTEIPCTCTLQFLLRGNTVHMCTYMRSNDAYIGLVHDIYSFTMLQEFVARELNADLGNYHHFVGSLHLYDRDRKKAQAFVREGLQSLENMMPEMPTRPRVGLEALLDAESRIRQGEDFDVSSIDEEYWRNLARLLLIHRAKKNSDHGSLAVQEAALAGTCYEAYVESLQYKLEKAGEKNV